jgi:hypothetical protein
MEACGLIPGKRLDKLANYYMQVVNDEVIYFAVYTQITGFAI